uniref:Uncharacterized protein n=1 Tax=Anguilla anguilla TaxID=7936 RepID=A0A0E9W502_ANGAN
MLSIVYKPSKQKLFVITA